MPRLREDEADSGTSTSEDQVLVRLCSDKVAYEARPAKPQRYDLGKVQAILAKGAPYATVVFTPYLIVLRRGNVEITMAQDGRLIIRRAESQAAARAVAEELLSLLPSALVSQP
ncbi:MAG: hypothetical protein QW057_00135 [Candidatus Bathyarchaeia archaeon]